MTTALATYMADRGIGDSDFADAVGRDRSMVSKLRRGVIRPTLELAASIEDETDGAVTMRSWVQDSRRSTAHAAEEIAA